jgi:hypothetical protein
LSNAIFFAGPFAKIDHFAALAAKRAKAVTGVPLMFFAAMRTGHYRCSFILGVGVKFL